jgi:hypothetical protein
VLQCSYSCCWEPLSLWPKLLFELNKLSHEALHHPILHHLFSQSHSLLLLPQKHTPHHTPHNNSSALTTPLAHTPQQHTCAPLAAMQQQGCHKVAADGAQLRPG